MAAHGSTTPHPEVIATKPLKAPFMAITKEKWGSPVALSSMYRFVNKAEIPPVAPARAVLTAAFAATCPVSSIPSTRAEPGLKPNPVGGTYIFLNEIYNQDIHIIVPNHGNYLYLHPNHNTIVPSNCRATE
jgi:hypothetical protein